MLSIKQIPQKKEFPESMQSGKLMLVRDKRESSSTAGCTMLAWRAPYGQDKVNYFDGESITWSSARYLHAEFEFIDELSWTDVNVEVQYA